MHMKVLRNAACQSGRGALLGCGGSRILWSAWAFRALLSMDDAAVQVVFYNVDQLMEVKREVMPLVRANSSKRAGTDAYAAFSGRDTDAKRTVQVQLLHGSPLLRGRAHVWRCTDRSTLAWS